VSTHRGDSVHTTLAAASRCEWCDAPLGDGVDRHGGRTRCRGCGAQTTDPVPSEQELERAYATWYRPRGGRFAGPGDALLRSSRGHLARRLDRIAPPGPILDVGAGDGALLDALRARGRTAVGLERHATRADMREAEITDIEGKWAAIVFWHTLEHLRHAGRAVEHAAGILDSDGVLIIAMPNPDSVQAKSFGDRWLALDLPRHLVHVPAGALVERLRSLELRVERIGYLRGGQVVFGWLHGLVGSLPGHPDLYDAMRRPQARRGDLRRSRSALALAAGAILLPLALTCAGIEAALRRGGTTYVEARRA
jgi:SAM-dependent methyltransferase